MSVWLCIPSARPSIEANRNLELWRQMGYKIALWRDHFEDAPIHDKLAVGAYPGYAVAVNRLAKLVLAEDPDCNWIVAAGDDTQPDLAHRAQVIAVQCTAHFCTQVRVQMSDFAWERSLPGTFGVMQPTGDRWADHLGVIIERIAGSPWLGREWCERAYGGQGPLWSEYTHCFADEELQLVAQKLGVFWQRPDLSQHHGNWARERGDAADMPTFLREANSPWHWDKFGRLFRQRKADGFPGHEPLGCA